MLESRGVSVWFSEKDVALGTRCFAKSTRIGEVASWSLCWCPLRCYAALRERCAAECAVRFEPVCANTGFFATSTKCFRAG